MKTLFTALLLISSFIPGGLLTAQQALFDDSFIHEIRINSTDPDFWQTIDDDYNFAFDLDSIPYRMTTVEIDVQDEYWGTYALIQQIDKYYLDRNFADNDGNLWKNKGSSNLSWQDTLVENYSFELQTNAEENDWSKFFEFIDVINNSSSEEFEAAISEIFHVDEYLRILAIDLITNNWDSYVQHGSTLNSTRYWT